MKHEHYTKTSEHFIGKLYNSRFRYNNKWVQVTRDKCRYKPSVHAAAPYGNAKTNKTRKFKPGENTMRFPYTDTTLY